MGLKDGDWARLGDCIRTARDRLGLTQRELAEMAGIGSVTTLITFEGGKAHTRWPNTLARLEAALGWPPGTARRIVMGEIEGPDEAAPPIGPMTAAEKDRFREMVRASRRLSKAAKDVMIEEIDQAPTLPDC